MEYSIYKKIVKEVVKYSYPFPNYQNIDNCDVINYYNNLLEDLGDNIKDLNKVYEYIKKDFGENSIDSYLRAKEARETGIYSEDEELNTKIKKFFNEYNLVTTKDSRFKLLCENDLPKDCLDIILTFLPNWDVIKSYYITLGSEKIKGCYYNISKMKKILDIKTFDINSLSDDIYQEFKEGDKIPLSEIKDKLGKIYKKFNYKASPKATDLRNYFEIREAVSYEKLGKGRRKQIKCYELLKRKGE